MADDRAVAGLHESQLLVMKEYGFYGGSSYGWLEGR